jgi:hypothetical protein
LAQIKPISTLKNLYCRKYAFQKLTKFSQGNNVLDAPDSNMNGYISRDMYVSSIQLNRPIVTNRAYLHNEKLKLQVVYLFQ